MISSIPKECSTQRCSHMKKRRLEDPHQVQNLLVVSRRRWRLRHRLLIDQLLLLLLLVLLLLVMKLLFKVLLERSVRLLDEELGPEHRRPSQLRHQTEARQALQKMNRMLINK